MGKMMVYYQLDFRDALPGHGFSRRLARMHPMILKGAD